MRALRAIRAVVILNIVVTDVAPGGILQRVERCSSQEITDDEEWGGARDEERGRARDKEWGGARI